MKRTTWHRYIRSHKKELLFTFEKTDSKWNWFSGATMWYYRGEICMEYFFHKHKLEQIKLNKHLIRTILKGKCDYFQGDELISFIGWYKNVIFSNKFKEEINK